jgi:hypothetical protein
MAKKRKLSKQFITHLKPGGHLNALLKRVQDDTTLDLEIRENYLNIYYRGGSLLKVSPMPKNPKAYTFEFNKRYAPKEARRKLEIPPPTISTPDEVEAWESKIPILKDTMDLWFGARPKDERALQQLVVWENNDSPWAGGTDYFIVDIEYDSRKGEKEAGGRFDLIAIRWESTPAARKLNGSIRPKLSVIEMKTGDGALKGKAGMLKHWNDFKKLSKPSTRAAFRKEMLDIFAQKRELGLIRSLTKNNNHIDRQALDPEIEFMFLLAGHDPASKKLNTELESLKGNPNVTLCTANFMGYGLYKENVYDVPEFMRRFEEQI